MNKKYAVCIGNNYPGTNAELRGCVNDALDWADLLSRSGYEVVMLREARFEETVHALEAAVGRAGYGDRIVFTYSGHGTWMPDLDGDETDGRDEALVMADYMEGGLLLDDHLQHIFGMLKTGSGALILSDSCHSGTVSRLLQSHMEIPAQRKFMSPVEFIDMSDERAMEAERVRASTPRRTASLISGCGDFEYSYDTSFGGRPNGAFTRIAIDAYREGISLASWHKAIRAKLPSLYFPQSPELTAASAYRKYLRAF